MLNDLVDNYGVIGVKAEFEAEGTRFEECVRLKEILTRAGLGLCLKIGGCEAIRDMYDARIIGADKIVAPMVESDFALKKFTESFEKVFSIEERESISFAVNLETKKTAQNYGEILASEDFLKLDCVVVGRNDLSYSMGLTREGVNEAETMNAAAAFLRGAKQRNPKIICGMGGGVSAASVHKFIDYVPNELDYFETRKVMFNFQNNFADFKVGILKALNFEVQWLKNKRDFYGAIAAEDINRINTLETRYSKSMFELGIKQ